MRKILTIALVWATLSLFSTGCVDVAPTDGSNPRNPGLAYPSVEPDPEPGVEGEYTTKLAGIEFSTNQPIIGVNYQESETGSYYGVASDISTPYVTAWDTGDYTLSIYPFEDVNYDDSVHYEEYTTRKISDDIITSAVYWNKGKAPGGHKESDYKISWLDEKYRYYGSGDEATPDLADDDDIDALANILDNDGAPVNQ